MIINADDYNYLEHYGIARRSGRYPWGSGKDHDTPEQRSTSFLGMVAELRGKGLSEVEIARGFGMTTSELRETNTIARNVKKQADISMAQRLKTKGMSNVAIGERMGIPESSVRALLAPGQKDKADVLQSTTDFLKNQVTAKGYIDVGSGVEHHMGVSRTKLDTAIARLKEEGYELHTVQIDQLGTTQKTLIKVLAPPGTTYRDIASQKDKIQHITGYSHDGGRSWYGILPPISVNPDRVKIRYKEEGGAAADGVIYVRPGVDDLSLGGSRYAQVRVTIGDKHYLKGMAMYKDDLPDGVDIMFNTNKSNTGNKLDAMKKLKEDVDGNLDKENPYGAVIRRQITTPDGKTVTSAMNLVNEEGNWGEWSRNLSSQFLSKQSPGLARTQLSMTAEKNRNELNQILSLTNPAVKKKLLEGYADSADAAAVHLKAAHMPRQASHVILPINSLKDTEIYAPNYLNGDRVVLVRFPHGGVFEIPELTVNNKHPEARKLLGNAKDAVGINSKVAEKLSGADFDGDTVLVIPNNQGKIRTKDALAGLKNFDPQSYKLPPEVPKMSSRTKGIQMGLVSNLITDMTFQGATDGELAQAVRHSMVVIDAEKHHLDYKRSAQENGISGLMQKYQGKKTGGAATLISRKKGTYDVPERKNTYTINRETGKKVFTETGASYVDGKSGKTIVKTSKVNKLGDLDNAHDLSSGTPIERVYADHSNQMKALANEARKAAVNTKTIPYSPSAKTAYADEVVSLNSKLREAQFNAPLERQAQVLANAQLKLRKQANPDMESAEIKKIKGQVLKEARTRTGAKKQQIELTDSEWDAIQAGAISNHMLDQILNNANLDRIKELATPRSNTVLTASMTQRAEQMLRSGYTQADVADTLGVSLSTLTKNIGV